MYIVLIEKYYLQFLLKFFVVGDITSSLRHENCMDSNILFIHCSQNIRIFHECEVLIEKAVPGVTVWHRKALPSDVKL